MWTNAPECKEPCATDLCCRRASSFLEVGGVGSFYCESCREIIERGRRYGQARYAIVETVPSGGALHRLFTGNNE